MKWKYHIWQPTPILWHQEVIGWLLDRVESKRYPLEIENDISDDVDSLDKWPYLKTACWRRGHWHEAAFNDPDKPPTYVRKDNKQSVDLITAGPLTVEWSKPLNSCLMALSLIQPDWNWRPLNLQIWMAYPLQHLSTMFTKIQGSVGNWVTVLNASRWFLTRHQRYYVKLLSPMIKPKLPTIVREHSAINTRADWNPT